MKYTGFKSETNYAWYHVIIAQMMDGRDFCVR